MHVTESDRAGQSASSVCISFPPKYKYRARGRRGRLATAISPTPTPSRLSPASAMLALSSHSSTPASDNSGPVPRGPFARRPSYVDLGDEDEDFWDEQDEQYRQREDYDSDPRLLEMRRSQLQPSRPMGPPQTDLRSRLTNRTAASPPRYDAPPLRAQWTGPTRPGPVRGASVRAAVSKFQYGTDASGSTPSLELQHSGTSGTTPVPIPKSGSHQESVEGNSLGLALSAPPAAGSLRDPESLRSHNPNLRVVNGELRMTVFPERKGSSGYATGQQLALARSDSIVASPPVHAGDDPIKQRIDQLERERAQSRAMVRNSLQPPRRSNLRFSGREAPIARAGATLSPASASTHYSYHCSYISCTRYRFDPVVQRIAESSRECRGEPHVPCTLSAF